MAKIKRPGYQKLVERIKNDVRTGKAERWSSRQIFTYFKNDPLVGLSKEEEKEIALKIKCIRSNFLVFMVFCRLNNIAI